MLGPLFLLVYRVVALSAHLAPRERGQAFKARWALYFSTLTDGGLDDDFVEQLFQIVRRTPGLLDRIELGVTGNGWIAGRKRMVIASVRGALNSGAESMFH